MKIKAIIFDLDGTLYDVGPRLKLAINAAIKKMISAGLSCKLDDALKKVNEIIKEGKSQHKFEMLVRHFGVKSKLLTEKELVEIGKNAYYNYECEKLDLYPEARRLLQELQKKYKLVLLTYGAKKTQNNKIDSADIRSFFDIIMIDEQNNKQKFLVEVMNKLNLNPKSIVSIGDRVDCEIKYANLLGMRTIRMKRGKYQFLDPKDDSERSDYTIHKLDELEEVLKLINKPKIVAIGGGTGLPSVMEGLKQYTNNLTAIVTVTDSGRSSGMLRKEMNVLPPGDIRNCLIALSNSEKLMKDLFQYRFSNGKLEGHSFGNLFIAVLSKITGSFEQSIKEVSKILKLEGKVLSSTLTNTHVCAELEDGNIIKEEDNIIDKHNCSVHMRSPIKRIFLDPEAHTTKEVVEEIKNADLIVMGPGCLYTSIITNLLVKGIPEAIKNSKAKKVYVCNIMTQQCQTHKYTASKHIKTLLEYLKNNLDYVIINTRKPPKRLLQEYEKEYAFLIENDFEQIEKLGVKIIGEDLIEKTSEKQILWEKKDLLRHDPNKIAKVLIRLINGNR